MIRTDRLRENKLKQIISKTVNKVLINEAMDPVAKIQNLIQQANDAYHHASDIQDNDKWPLMDKEGNPYGLSSDIKLDGRGYVVIPFNGGSYSGYDPTKIKVLSKIGGKIKIFKGDYFDEGWKDASKILKKIIKDAEIGISNFKEYDPNWETSDSSEELKAHKAALKDFNKKIGRKSFVGMDYLSEKRLNSIVLESVKKVLRESFEDSFNSTRDDFYKRRNHGMFGFELKNKDGDWEYGEVTYDPKTQKMCCMGVCIDVDPDMTVDQNLEGLYEELMNNGYNND